MALALVMLMGAFIKICSLHTKSDNPNLVPHRDFPGNFRIRAIFSTFFPLDFTTSPEPIAEKSLHPFY